MKTSSDGDSGARDFGAGRESRSDNDRRHRDERAPSGERSSSIDESAGRTGDSTRSQVGTLSDRSPAPGSAQTDHAPLFPADDADRFRSRWSEIQTNFVDEPRRSVEQADNLVAEVTDRLTAAFSQNRSKLEKQWSAGDEVSTEELRRTLQQYRSFFERLLTL